MSNSLLIFTSYFIPAYKAGGPIRSISSLIDNIHSHFEISVVTRNHDIRDRKNFSSIKHNIWLIYDNYSCLYLSYLSSVPIFILFNRIRKSEFKYIYFNSFFDFKFSIIPLFYLKLINFFGYNIGCKIIVAPRGEFSHSALNNKKLLKRIIIYLFKFFSVNRYITWHATSISEQKDIFEIFGLNHNIFLLENFPSSKPVDFSDVLLRNKSNIFKVVFIGRVSRMKNLLDALNILKNVKSNIIFDVYGPAEDIDYFNKCITIVQSLPDNVKVNFYGEIKHHNVCSTLSKYDLFFSPTLGENYGHAIVEAFLVGCPVLISDNTPWRELKQNHAGFDISLDNLEEFSFTIDFFAKMDDESYKMFKIGSYNYGLKISNNSSLKEGYLNLFN